jgi:hypothetical protein
MPGQPPRSRPRGGGCHAAARETLRDEYDLAYGYVLRRITRSPKALPQL